MSIRTQIPDAQGIKDQRVTIILTAIKRIIENITGRSPTKPLIVALAPDASVPAVLNKVNEVIARIQETDDRPRGPTPIVVDSPDAGSFGDATHVPSIDVNSSGIITSAQNVPIALGVTGDATGTLPGVITFSAVTTSTGAFQQADISVDAKGRVILAANGSYEDQTAWTPVLTFASAGDLAITYNTQKGFYIRQRKLVTLFCQIVTSAFTWSTSSGNLQVTGIPYASINTPGLIARGNLGWQGITFATAGYTSVNPRLIFNSSTIEFAQLGSALNAALLTTADVPSGGTVVLSFTLQYLIP